MSVIDQLVGLYAPHYCLGCHRAGSPLCDSCRSRLSVPASVCYTCGALARLGRCCPQCRPASALVSCNSATTYDGLAKQLIFQLKYDRSMATAQVMAARMVDLYGPVTPNDAIITAVPTASRRVRSRGYDQAVLIARAYAKLTGRTYRHLLERRGSTEQKTACRQERFLQLEGAFVVRRPLQVEGCRVLLIDDVITTGASFEEAARALRKAGARTVGAVSFAKVL